MQRWQKKGKQDAIHTKGGKQQEANKQKTSNKQQTKNGEPGRTNEQLVQVSCQNLKRNILFFLKFC